MTIGLTEFHLLRPSGANTDAGAHPPGQREFMISAFYPAEPASGTSPCISAAQMLGTHPDAVLKRLLARGLDAAQALDTLKQIRAPFHVDAQPLQNGASGYPVILYYPGGQGHRHGQWELFRLVVQAGFLVLALDTPGDAPFVTFPGGRVDVETRAEADYIWPRVGDILHLLDMLSHLNAKGTLAGMLDLDRIAMAGHSRGGYLANICAVEDERVKAAVNMDGFFWGYWADGTGLQKHSPQFQAKAGQCAIPFLRLCGDQQTAEQFEAGFLRESTDVRGDFIRADFPGADHAWFGGHNWLCGKRGNISMPTAQSRNAAASAIIAPILIQFFHAALCGQAMAPEQWALPGRSKVRIGGRTYSPGARG